MAKGIEVPKRAARTPVVQIACRVPVDVAKSLRLFAVTNDVLMQDVIVAGIRAVIGAKAPATA